jgi:hypothetical protein
MFAGVNRSIYILLPITMGVSMKKMLSTAIATTLTFFPVSGIVFAKDIDYKATVEVTGSNYSTDKYDDTDQNDKDDSAGDLVTGWVFKDRNRNGVMDRRERGIKNVMVSNGREVVLTDKHGFYLLPAYQGMTVFVTKPAGFEVPVDEYNVPQFSYHHMPDGSPDLRFGGLPATGPLPQEVNFPLIKGKKKKKFKMIVIGDTQPYSNNEVGYVRDTLANEFASMNMHNVEGIIVEGDVVGDDLGLYPRFKQILSVANVPQYFVPGNHDLDFDAPSDANSFDTFKREWGPAYYSFDIGEVHFITLDNVQYPCENYDGSHEFCDTSATYNGVVNEQQMEWLANDLALVPKHKLIVLNMHIPIISFVDSSSNKHQTDNAGDIYRLLDGRPALALSGHTHTLEHFEPGEGARADISGLDIPATPFPQIITGAGCGSWWSGDFDDDGVPMSYQRLGAKRGYLVFKFNGNTYEDTFKATGEPAQKQIAVSLLSPTFTAWYNQLLEWLQNGAIDKPPVNINDLDDTKIIPKHEIHETILTANVWNGSSATRVSVKIDNRDWAEMERSEKIMDPFALEKQMYVFRYAAESTSANPRAQGFELWTGSSNGPSSPRPSDEWMHTDVSNHLWQIAVPSDLDVGVHTAKVKAVDKFANKYTETLVFEIREERPERFFRNWLFE